MDILYVKVVDRKIEIHTTTGVLEGAVMLQLERLLPEYEKINQNVLVNINEVGGYDHKEMKIHFENGEYFYVSRTNRKKVASYFDKK